MDILFLSDNFPPERNAAASRIYERARYWIEWGHQVTIITCAPNFPEGKLFPGYKNKLYQSEIMDGIRIVRVKTFISANKGFFLRILDYVSYTLPAIIAGLLQKRPDMIVANSPTPFVALAGLIVAKLRKKPFVLEVSDLWPASITGVGAMREGFAIRCLEKLELFLYRHAQAIIVLTSSFKENLIARAVDKHKIHIVINGVDSSRYYPRVRNNELAKRYDIKPDDFVIGYIGTHGMAHALENVLYSAEQLLGVNNLCFIFVGAGASREKLMQISKEKSLTNVRFIPSQPKEYIPEFWALCNMALVHLKNSPVFADVIPSKIFEAMGMGKSIIIAAPKGEASTLIEEEKIGIGVPPENPSALTEVIRLYQGNPQLVEELSRNSHEAAAKYTRERQAKKFLSIMNDLRGHH